MTVVLGLSVAPMAHAANNTSVMTAKNAKTYIYNAKGVKVGTLNVGVSYWYDKKTSLKIGKKKYTVYLISKRYKQLKNKTLYVKANSVNIAKVPKKTKVTMKVPKGYTLNEVFLAELLSKPTDAFLKANMDGMKQNTFSSSIDYENAKDLTTKVDLNKLSTKNREVLAKFALKVLNQFRKQLKLPAWKYSKGTQKLALDVAKQYQTDKATIQDQQHNVSGIVKAAKKNGLIISDNSIEDLAGFALPKKTHVVSMNVAKKLVYFGLKQMLFGYKSNGEDAKSISNKDNYTEWYHAGDLLNKRGGKSDGQWNYFGFSISHVGNIYSMHFINVPTVLVKDKTVNKGFKP